MNPIKLIKLHKKKLEVQECGQTGYFENLIHRDLGLQPGETGWFYDEDNRFVVVMATSVGNVVCFQRYADRGDLITSNSPLSFERLIPNPIENWEKVHQYTGFVSNSFHRVVESIKSAA